MSRLKLPLTLLTVLACASPAPAQDSPPAPLAPVSDYLEAQTMVAVRVDLTKLRLTETLPWLARATKSEAAGQAAIEEAQELLKQLTSRGAQHAFVLASLSDVLQQRQPAVLIPVKDPQRAADELAAQRAPLPPFQVLGSCLFLGDPRTRERLSRRPSARRPDLETAAAAAASYEHFLVVALPAEIRRVLVETLPDLPDAYGGAKGGQLAAFDWAYLGLRLPPNPETQLKLATGDAESAEALKKTLATLLPKVNVPLAALLPIKQQGRELVATVDDKNLHLSSLLSLTDELKGLSLGSGGPQGMMNQMKQIGLAMHNYHEVFGAFPPLANASDDGKPLLSWRVHLLPFLGHAELHDKFHLDEPWDSPHNKALIDQMPQTYRSPRGEKVPPGQTVMQTPIMDGSLLGDSEVPRIRDISDGTSNTVMVVAVHPSQAVVWTRPDDIRVDQKQPKKGLTRGDGGLMVGMCDGSVQSFSGKLDPKIWLAMLTKAGGEVINWEEARRP